MKTVTITTKNRIFRIPVLGNTLRWLRLATQTLVVAIVTSAEEKKKKKKHEQKKQQQQQQQKT